MFGKLIIKEMEYKRKWNGCLPIKNIRSNLIDELETFLVGPRSDDEILGSKIRPMVLYLTGKLVPLGATSDVVNEKRT